MIAYALAAYRFADETSADFSERFYFWSQILAPLLVVASFGFLGIQVYDLRRAQDAQGLDSTSDRLAKITSLTLDWPDTYPYFYSAAKLAPTASPELVARVKTIAEMKLDMFDGEMLRRSTFGTYRGEISTLNEWVRDSLVDSPEMRAFLIERRNWYSSALVSLCESVDQGDQP